MGVEESLCVEEVPIEILVWQVKKLRNKEVASLKVLWRNRLVEDVILKAKAYMISCFPHPFNFFATLDKGMYILKAYALVSCVLDIPMSSSFMHVDENLKFWENKFILFHSSFLCAFDYEFLIDIMK